MARAHDTLDDLVWITRYLAKPAAGQDLLPSRLERRTGLATGAFTSFAGTDATLPMDRLVIQVQLFDGHATSHTKHSGSEIVTREELNPVRYGGRHKERIVIGLQFALSAARN
jgi:hypothetical protein